MFNFFQCILIISASVNGEDYDQEDEKNYEPFEGACDKCKCTNITETLKDDEIGLIFTIDCTTKNVQHLFNEWPEEMESHNSKSTASFL